MIAYVGRITPPEIKQSANVMQEALNPYEMVEPSITLLKNQVWKVKTSRKLQHFLGQALTGCIATCSRLADRHCVQDMSCPRCGFEEETINHLIFECPPATQVWALSPIPTNLGIFPSTSLFSNLSTLFRRFKEKGVNEDHIKFFPWIIWYIWKARNKKAFSGEDISPAKTLQIAQQEAECWFIANQQETGDNREETRQITDVEVTELAQTVCQIDASWKKDDPMSGCGFTLKQGNTEHMTGMRGSSRVLSPLHAEFEALLWAMECLREHGYNEIHMKMDCAQLITMLSEDEVWPAFSSEMDEFFVLQSLFSKSSISLITRNVNTRADNLAKAARAKNFVFILVNPMDQYGMDSQSIPRGTTD